MIVIFNPTAGSRRRGLLDRVLSRLAAAGAEVALHPTAPKRSRRLFSTADPSPSIPV